VKERIFGVYHWCARCEERKNSD